MKLTKDDKAILMEFGYPNEDLRQIEKAIGKTKYTLSSGNRVSAERAVELLGRRTYLSGIARSAFHRTAVRQVENSKETVFFDSSKLFI